MKKLRAMALASALIVGPMTLIPAQASTENHQQIKTLIQMLYSDKVGQLKAVDEDTYTSTAYKVEVENKNKNLTFRLIQKGSKKINSSTLNDNEASLDSAKVKQALAQGATLEKSVPFDNGVAWIGSSTQTISVGQNFEANLLALDESGQALPIEYSASVDTSKEGVTQLVAKTKKASFNLEVNVVDDHYYDRIAQAALAQIGVNQDCTMLVTNSLAAVGINFHGWPEEYASLGEWTTNPVPGDLCIYSGHVAVYVGNGQAVHGGFLGNQTVLYSVQCTNPFLGYIHVNR